MDDRPSVESLLWPGGWPPSNRKRDWETLRQTLVHLGTIRPVVYGPDGLPYLYEVVSCPAVPKIWDPAAICPLRIAPPPQAAAGAVIDFNALRRCGAAAWSPRRCSGRTWRRWPCSTTPPGKPKRGRRGRIVRDPTWQIPNPAARYVGKLTDDDLRRMIGLTDHRENCKRARKAFEWLHNDKVIDLRREKDGHMQLFAAGE